MTLNGRDLLYSRLKGQFLTEKTDALSAAGGLCGVQAQFYGAAVHALRLRSGDSGEQLGSMYKTWALRGTLHLIPRDDLPLYCPRQGEPEDVPSTEMYRWMVSHGYPIDESRAKRFARVLYGAVAGGVSSREALRSLCLSEGMTAEEERHIFQPWGGMLRQLGQLGRIAWDASSEKRLTACAPFEPMKADDALQTLIDRYLTHCGPVSLNDAAYFFRLPRRRLRAALEATADERFTLKEQTFYARSLPEDGAIPACVLLAGFDPMLMSYDKEDNPILPAEYLRQVFTMTGIVHPTVLLDGRIAGRWKAEKNAVSVFPFRRLKCRERDAVAEQAERYFPEKQICFTE